MRRTLLVLFVFLVLVPSVCEAGAETSPAATETPVLKSGALPLYPELARQARIQGTVRLEVTTDGVNVKHVVASGAHKLLMNAAEAYVKTWKFYKHPPQTFTVIFDYKLEKQEVSGFVNPTEVLELPNRIEIRTKMLAIETITH